MNRRLGGALCCLAGALMLGATSAEDARRSGSEFMSASTQAMQRDDTLNPAMLWISGGEAQWGVAAGKSGKSCASCHGEANQSMRGVAARYPAFHAGSKATINLGQRINVCREQKQQAPALRAESEELLGLEAYVAMQSRGMPVEPPQDAGTRVSAARGKELVVYIAPDFEGRDALLAKLGEHKTGKVCVYIRRLANVDLNVLEKLVARSVADTKRRYPPPSENDA